MRCLSFPSQRTEQRAIVPWPKVQRPDSPSSLRRTASILKKNSDRFDNIDPIAIREALAERGIVDGQVENPEETGQ